MTIANLRIKIIKKFILVFAIVIATFSFSYTQELGVRFGDVSGGNVPLMMCFQPGSLTEFMPMFHSVMD